MYKLSPSDLTFAWDGSKYCSYMKVKHSIVLRGIFGKMANLTSAFYDGKPIREISPALTLKLSTATFHKEDGHHFRASLE